MSARFPTDPRVHLYCRADPAPPARRRQRAVRDRLATLVDRGDVESVEARTWPASLPDESEGTDRALDPAAPARSAYREFVDWAAEAGASLAPFFDERERYTLDDPGAATREVVLPVVGLTVRDGERVVAAYPHTADGEPREVDDALAVLESGSVDPEVAADGPPSGVAD